MWITWKIFSWIIVFVMNMGKNTNMEETSELKLSVATLILIESMNALNMRGRN